MKYLTFIGQVQHRGQMASGGAAVRAIHATLQTLSEHLTKEEAKDLAAQLPREIGFYLTLAERCDRTTMDEFFDRIAMREGVEPGRSMRHARAVLDVLIDAVSPGEIADARAQLPPDLAWLLEKEDALV